MNGLLIIGRQSVTAGWHDVIMAKEMYTYICSAVKLDHPRDATTMCDYKNPRVQTGKLSGGRPGCRECVTRDLRPFARLGSPPSTSSASVVTVPLCDHPLQISNRGRTDIFRNPSGVGVSIRHAGARRQCSQRDLHRYLLLRMRAYVYVKKMTKTFRPVRKPTLWPPRPGTV